MMAGYLSTIIFLTPWQLNPSSSRMHWRYSSRRYSSFSSLATVYSKIWPGASTNPGSATGEEQGLQGKAAACERWRGRAGEVAGGGGGRRRGRESGPRSAPAKP